MRLSRQSLYELMRIIKALMARPSRLRPFPPRERI
jgi:hypothetical protein